MTNESTMRISEPASLADETAGATLTPGPDETLLGEQPLDEVMRARLSDALSTVTESADPVAGLETALEGVAQDLSRYADAAGSSEVAAEPGEEIETAISTLVSVALETADPVAALEEGADSLAEALAARDAAADEWRRNAREQEIEFEGAYRHARLHRVAELMDVGYSLDQAVAITNANEAEIQARALAAGRNPMEPIYQYAVLNGYRGIQSPARDSATAGAMPAVATREGQGPLSAMQALVAMSDEAFAEATQGERWQKLMRRS